MKNTPIIVICKLPISPEALAAIDRMAARDGLGRDKLLADFASWLAMAESSPAVALVKDLAKQVIADRRAPR